MSAFSIPRHAGCLRITSIPGIGRPHLPHGARSGLIDNSREERRQNAAGIFLPVNSDVNGRAIQTVTAM